MSCGTCAEKTRRGVASAIGSPAATGARVFIVEHRAYVNGQLEDVVAYVASSLDKAAQFMSASTDYDRPENAWHWAVSEEEVDADPRKTLTGGRTVFYDRHGDPLKSPEAIITASLGEGDDVCGTCSEETTAGAASAIGACPPGMATGGATTRLSSPKSGTNRARAGGEIGVNGEHYEGGQFLPSTTLPKQAPTSRKAGTGKREIAPYVWEVAPNGKRPIYTQFQHLWKITNGKAAVIDNAQALAYYKRSAEEVQAAADQWNAGERWMP